MTTADRHAPMIRCRPVAFGRTGGRQPAMAIHAAKGGRAARTKQTSRSIGPSRTASLCPLASPTSGRCARHDTCSTYSFTSQPTASPCRGTERNQSWHQQSDTTILPVHPANLHLEQQHQYRHVPGSTPTGQTNDMFLQKLSDRGSRHPSSSPTTCRNRTRAFRRRNSCSCVVGSHQSVRST